MPATRSQKSTAKPATRASSKTVSATSSRRATRSSRVSSHAYIKPDPHTAAPGPERAEVRDMGDAWRIWLWIDQNDVIIVPGALPNTHRVTRQVAGCRETVTFTLINRGLRPGPFDYLIGTNPHGAYTPLQIRQATTRARIAALEQDAAIRDEEMQDKDGDEDDFDYGDDDDEDDVFDQGGRRGRRKRNWLDESDDDECDGDGYRSSTESDQEWFEREIMGRTREEVGARWSHLMRTGRYPP